ncbi:MAG TPA: PspA/IM30 family protein [Ktedonobacteraceae bacterium]|nr:PspA/IM30 family protein [Ktedonobacteraceae bacterium]
MNLLERVLTLLRANLNALAEKSEDPEKMLLQLQLDMRNQLVQVKTQVATAIAETMKLQKRSKEKQIEASSWLKKAEQAVQQNNENAARDFLSRYNDLNRQALRYQQQQKEQEQLGTTMRGILRQLEAKISEVNTTIDLLTARKRAALLQQRVYDTLSKSGSLKDKERANRAQDALLDIEARARALADLQQHELDTQLAQISQEQLIEAQLQQLKGPRHFLSEGQPHSADLILPVPAQNEPARKHPANQSPAENLPSGPSDVLTAENQELDLEKLKRLMDK